MTDNRSKPLSSASSRSIKAWLPLVLGAALLSIAAFALTFQFVKPAPPRQITIATGSEDGAYTHFAKQYAAQLANEGITLTLKPSAGSVENLKWLSQADSEVDLAFIQGGVNSESAQAAQLVGLASVYYEPLWVFHPKSQAPLSRLSDLTGQRLAIGPEGSGTRLLMQQLLGANALSDHIEVSDTQGDAAFSMLTQGQLDAVALISSDSSALVQRYLDHPDLEAMSFARAEAYQRHFTFLSRLSYPRGMFSLAKDLPAKDLKLIAPTATLVAKPSLHPALISLLLQAANHVHRHDNHFSPAGSFPSAQHVAFPISDEARRQLENGPPLLQRYLPFWAANLVDRLKILLLPLIALMIPLSRMLPPLYRWRMRSRVYSWYDEIQHIDIRARNAQAYEEIQRSCQELDVIEAQVRNIEVPLSFADELYRLRQHIELIRAQIERVAKSP